MTGRGPSAVDPVLREFYAGRGYDHRMGPGDAPALLVIDFSLAFTRSSSAFPGGAFEAEIVQTKRLLAAFRPDHPVVFTTIAYAPDRLSTSLWARKVPWLSACEAGSEAVAIDPELEMASTDILIEKEYPSAFHGTDLEERLRARGVDTVILTGCTTSVCVRATAVDAMQRGFRPILVADAIGEFMPALHQLHLLDVGSRYGDVTTTEGVLGYMDNLARGEVVAPDAWSMEE